MTAVQDILRRIDSLSEQQRMALERQLARRAQAEWKRLTGEARRLARRRGVDQQTIDRAVARRRYGR